MPKNPFTKDSGGSGPPADRSAESAEGLRADAHPPEHNAAAVGYDAVSGTALTPSSREPERAAATSTGAAGVAAPSTHGGAEDLVFPVTAPAQEATSAAESSSRNPSPRAAAPVVIKTKAEAVQALAVALDMPPRVMGALPPRRRMSRRKEKVERGDGRCQAYAPKGTKCKLCGKVHPF